MLIWGESDATRGQDPHDCRHGTILCLKASFQRKRSCSVTLEKKGTLFGEDHF